MCTKKIFINVFFTIIITFLLIIINNNQSLAFTNLSNCNITLSKTSYTYSGSEIKPSVVVKYKNKVVSNNNYTISYSNNKNVGTGTVTIKAKGLLYSGEVKKYFTINKATLTKENVNLYSSLTYTGKKVNPLRSVTYLSKTLTLDKDYTVTIKNNINAGTGTIIVTGKNNFKGSVSKNFKIEKRNLSECNVGTVFSYTYTGSQIKPTPKVDYLKTNLTLDVDYTYSYKNNINAGTGTVTVTGKGNFTGSVSKNFTINKKDISGYHIYLYDYTFKYTGKEIKPKIKCVQYIKTVLPSSNYTVSYQNNTKVGTGKIIVTGKGNYCGTTSNTFKIVK